jgi:colanic acid biosynthesis protein WcaH
MLINGLDSLKMNDSEKFLQIVDSTPLVSIDLILEDPQERVLLGMRNNRPAKGFWFVPGGSIRKNERLCDAFKRISSIELGAEIAITNATLVGAFDHIYEDNYLGAHEINTHYVVLAYKVKTKDDFQFKPDNQHSEMKWWFKEQLLSEPKVHQNTKAYFV